MKERLGQTEKRTNERSRGLGYEEKKTSTSTPTPTKEKMERTHPRSKFRVPVDLSVICGLWPLFELAVIFLLPSSISQDQEEGQDEKRDGVDSIRRDENHSN